MAVSTDAGITGYASGGDGLPDRALLERLLVGVDPRQGEVVREICETDRLPRRPPLGGRGGLLGHRRQGGRRAAVAAARRSLRPHRSRMPRVASWPVPTSARRAPWPSPTPVCARPKIRFHHADWRDDVAVIAQVREAVGDRLELMVDANQGWRMPGDRAPRWDVATAARVANELGGPRRLLARGAAALRGLRRLRGAAPPHRRAHRRRRDGANDGRGARPASCAAASTCCRPTSC